MKNVKIALLALLVVAPFARAEQSAADTVATDVVNTVVNTTSNSESTRTIVTIVKAHYGKIGGVFAAVAALAATAYVGVKAYNDKQADSKN